MVELTPTNPYNTGAQGKTGAGQTPNGPSRRAPFPGGPAPGCWIQGKPGSAPRAAYAGQVSPPSRAAARPAGPREHVPVPTGPREGVSRDDTCTPAGQRAPAAASETAKMHRTPPCPSGHRIPFNN